MGSEFGAFTVSPSSFGSNTSPFASLPALGTPLGLVTGKILAISQNGNFAVFSDTVSTPNQVYIVSTASSPPTSTPLNINSAIAAAFSPDGLKVFILGNGGTTLYVYSTLQALQTLPPNPLPTPATSIAFSSTGAFALLAGGGAAGQLSAYNTCDDSQVSLAAGAVSGPPMFLKMVPAGLIPQGNPNGNQFGSITIPNLEPQGLDFFFGLDNTGIDIIATNTSLLPLPVSAGPLTLNTLCPRFIVNAQNAAAPYTTFDPMHIDIGQGTFHPINFFLSPDATKAYIVAPDLGVRIYDFNTRGVSSITLVNNATPVAADMTVDGSLIYVAGSDGLLHELNTALVFDQNQVSFPSLPNSPNNFCFTGTNCKLNVVAVKP
jgi:hypothetical protein